MTIQSRKLEQAGRGSIIIVAIAAMSQAIPTTHAAGPFTIGSRTTGLDLDNPVENTVYLTASGLADTLESTVNTSFFSDASRSTVTESLAVASGSVGSGLIVDRISDPDSYSVTAGLGGNVYSPTGGGPSFSVASNSLPSFGAAVVGGVTIGAKASRLGIPKLGPLIGNRLMINFTFLTYSQEVSSVAIDFLNLGLNFQYRLIDTTGSKWLFKWHGLNMATGFNYSTSSASFASTLSQNSSEGTESMNLDLAYRVGIKSNNFYIPVEISSGFQLFYLFNFYSGISLDLNFGSASLIGLIDGDVAATSTAPGLSSSNVLTGKASMDLEESGPSASPSALQLRMFVGTQVPLGPVKFAVEYTTQHTGAYGVTGMVRFAM